MKEPLPKAIRNTLVLATAALLFGSFFAAIHIPILAATFILPVIFLSAILTIGHLVTFDDDFPGGWSNMDSDPKILIDSIIELLVKASFGLAGVAIIWLFSSMPAA